VSRAPGATGRFVLFSPGPVNVADAVRERVHDVELSHRQPEFEELLERVRRTLHAELGMPPASHNLTLLPGSGTLAVEAGLASLVRGRVLVVDNGQYCARIAKALAAIDGADPIVHAAGLGVPPDLDRVEADVAREPPAWIAMVHHETTSGLLNPLGAIASIAERHGCRLFVDAVSAAGAHPLDARADVVCLNSNKCLESYPGVAGVFWRRDLAPYPALRSLDVDLNLAGTRSTPNVQALIALDAALELLAAEDRPARYARLASAVRREAEPHFEPLLPAADRSNVLTAFRVDGRDADALLARARDHGYVLYPGRGELRGEVFSVANMGALIDEACIADLFSVLAG
jgi:2-aminoethylphosphonate-pyruvate transaminase